LQKPKFFSTFLHSCLIIQPLGGEKALQEKGDNHGKKEANKEKDDGGPQRCQNNEIPYVCLVILLWSYRDFSGGILRFWVDGVGRTKSIGE